MFHLAWFRVGHVDESNTSIFLILHNCVFIYREALTTMQWQQQTFWRQMFQTLVGNHTTTCPCWQEPPMETKVVSISWSQPPWTEASFTSAKHKLETRGGSREPTNLSRKQPLLSVLLKCKATPTEQSRTMLCFLSSFVSCKKMEKWN